MEEICRLEMREAVTIDPDRLVELCVSMGELKAEAMITTAIEELARGIVEVETAYRQHDLHALQDRASVMAKTAEHIGMTTFARVAEDVMACAQACEGIPLAATLTRLRRIADRSLSAVWDMQDIRV
ncbi:hypothetical protein C8N43_2692 [Litoreibacter ponti]|uniref:Hpt domain-containing protein n=1 Tax=Litoreibacter ponti TaxID=1510457 RepID=A0A2T6BPN3_9RHOB|nr:hypothetical protein [Litoreibacter ponti]PTX58016.1 hypothetical protein C8N43_2692 [Litoreibacter ponti]